LHVPNFWARASQLGVSQDALNGLGIINALDCRLEGATLANQLTRTVVDFCREYIANARNIR